MEIHELISKDIKYIEDIKQILNFLVSITRKQLNINDSSTRLCQESSIYLMKLCDKFNIPYIPINMGELGMKDLEHHFGVTGFQTEFGQICFLLDLTYIQFTEEKYPVNGNSVLSPVNFISDENKDMLVQKGYLTLTEENLNDYIRSFVETYKLVNKTNEAFIYDKLYSLLNTFHINLVDKDYLNNKEITY